MKSPQTASVVLVPLCSNTLPMSSHLRTAHKDKKINIKHTPVDLNFITVYFYSIKIIETADLLKKRCTVHKGSDKLKRQLYNSYNLNDI